MNHKKQIEQIRQKQEIESFSGECNRARSVTVGTAFGGTTELMMRGNDGSVLWCIMQPVEVIELIHQLSANVGCHIALKPRDDFASWRNWKTGENLVPGIGWPPFANDLAPHSQVGAQLPAPEEQPGLQPKLMKRKQNETVATKKTVNRRSTKRTAKAA